MHRSEPLKVNATQVRALTGDYERFHGRPPDARELASLVDDWVDEELTVEAAYDLDLHRDDPVIRRRLIRKMELLSDDPGAAPEQLIEQALVLGLDRTDPIVRRRLVYLMQERWTVSAPSEEAKSGLLDREQERLRRERGVVIEEVVIEEVVIEDLNTLEGP